MGYSLTGSDKGIYPSEQRQIYDENKIIREKFGRVGNNAYLYADFHVQQLSYPIKTNLIQICFQNL